MMSSQDVALIVNPNAGNGAVAKDWPSLEALARNKLGSLRSFMTSVPNEAETLVVQAVEEGARTVICIGGDGTFNEVVNGMMRLHEAIRSDIVIGFIPFGTGCDFARTIAIPKNPERALDIISAKHLSRIDIGRLEFQDHNDQKQGRYFHNIASFGLGGEVDQRVNRTTKVFGPFLSFIWATIISILCYGKKSVHLQIDDTIEKDIVIWNIAVANGQYHGGGMRVAPDATPTDGMFNITVIGDLSLAKVFLNLQNLYNGKIYAIEKVSHFCGKKIFATSEQRVLLDVDGEQPGILPVSIDIVPQALNLYLPSSFGG